MAIRTTKAELAIGTAPQEATLTGIRTVYHEEGDYEGQVKGYWIQSKEFQDLYLNYNNKNPENMFELDNLMEQLIGTGKEFDDEKMDAVGKDYAGTVILVCKRESEKYAPGNVCFNKNYKPTAQAAKEACPF